MVAPNMPACGYTSQPCLQQRCNFGLLLYAACLRRCQLRYSALLRDRSLRHFVINSVSLIVLLLPLPAFGKILKSLKSWLFRPPRLHWRSKCSTCYRCLRYSIRVLVSVRCFNKGKLANSDSSAI